MKMTMIRRIAFSLTMALAVVSLARPAVAQTTVPSTTLSATIGATDQQFSVANAGTIAVGYTLMVDKEAMTVNAVSGNFVTVQRGTNSSPASGHVASQTVYYGPPASGTSRGPFWPRDPELGTCTLSAENYSVRLVPITGRIWACTNGQWANQIDTFMFVDPGACQSGVSGNSTGTNGLTVIGSSAPVVQAQTSGSGTNTHFYDCNLPIPSRPNVLTAVYVVDVNFYYGVQTTGLGTQAVTLASGMLNFVPVFTYVTLPVAGNSETAQSILAASRTRADSGTLVMTPTAANFNVATTTAGSFYTVKFTPSAPFAMSLDGTQYHLNVGLLNTATSATITNSPGFVVHYRILQIGI